MSSDRPVLVLLAAGLAKRYGGCKPLAPVGLHGEAVIDLTAADAAGAGFGDVVLVLGPTTGAAIEYHVRRTWPATLDVRVAVQPAPLGTAHAVLCARQAVGDRRFAVVNGDDVYGTEAFAVLARHLQSSVGDGEHALVAFALADSVVGTAPVTRGTVRTSGDGLLLGIDERRGVRRRDDGTFGVGDGRSPAVLAPDTPVSVNLWGFHPTIWPVLADAVAAVHPGAVAADGTAATHPTASTGAAEVLLPEVIGAAVADGSGIAVRVLHGPGRCVGVTHADDLPLVRAVLAAMVGAGTRPEQLWPVPA
jgi:hypothetical protein